MQQRKTYLTSTLSGQLQGRIEADWTNLRSLWHGDYYLKHDHCRINRTFWGIQKTIEGSKFVESIKIYERETEERCSTLLCSPSLTSNMSCSPRIQPSHPCRHRCRHACPAFIYQRSLFVQTPHIVGWWKSASRNIEQTILYHADPIQTVGNVLQWILYVYAPIIEKWVVNVLTLMIFSYVMHICMQLKFHSLEWEMQFTRGNVISLIWEIKVGKSIGIRS